MLVEELARTIATPDAPVLLVAEGLPGGQVVVPEGAPRRPPRWTIIVDPIDGTRGLMYQKRPAWILTGVAPGPARARWRTSSSRCRRRFRSSSSTCRTSSGRSEGSGVSATRFNRLTGESAPLDLQPSTATTIAHGFATIARFFPGNRAELAAIDDEVVAAVLGPPQPGKAQSFEDQYICTGGQLYELMAGHDRFVADLRPLVRAAPSGRRRAVLPSVRPLHRADRA